MFSTVDRHRRQTEDSEEKGVSVVSSLEILEQVQTLPILHTFVLQSMRDKIFSVSQDIKYFPVSSVM